MLGERGLWFKMNFFEGSARVPLMIAALNMSIGRVDHPVSTMDVLPTLAELAGINMDEIMPWTDGASLVSMNNSSNNVRPVRMEYAAEASNAPMVALRYKQWKYVHCELDPPQLFDLDNDPLELANLATNASHAETAAMFAQMVQDNWNMADFDAEVRQSQARRRVVYEALRNGSYFPWDYQPLQKASERYMRNHMDLNAVEEKQRYPCDLRVDKLTSLTANRASARPPRGRCISIGPLVAAQCFHSK